MKIVSYCTPVKDRTQDVLETLAENLAANRVHQDKIEFIVAIFDNNDFLATALSSKFTDELASGYLKIHQILGLDYWHFGRAKNAFKTLMSGKLYSSLDADNFVGAQETAQILELYDEHGENLLFHHFSGAWGDGTCGRVTLSADRYRSIGYDERLLPRQFDEMDAILSTVCAYPDTIYVSHFENGAFSKSTSLKAFCRDEGIVIQNQVVPDLRTQKPLNQKGELYVRNSAWLEPMQIFNIASSLLKNSSSTPRKYEFSNDARKAGSDLVDKASEEELSRWFFGIERSAIPLLKDGAIPVVACVRNEEEFLLQWYEHHKKIGAGPFIVVDDRSTTPISDILPFDDVHVLRPVAGSYFTCKAVWLKAAMKCFVPMERWSVTVDADEFLDLPSRWTTVQHYAKAADADGLIGSPGLLIDMVPDPTNIGTLASIDHFDRHLLDWSLRDVSYGVNPSIKWAFGKHWNLSCVVDARYHLFGTIDVLRKVPMLKNLPNMELNQGFHDVSTPSQKTIPHGMWRSRFLLPIRHFKLMKLFKADLRARLSAQAKTPCVYHSRTTDNFSKMLAVGEQDLLSKLRKMKTVKYDRDFIFGLRFRYLSWDAKGVLSGLEKFKPRIGFLRKRKIKNKIAASGKQAVLLALLLQDYLADLTDIVSG